MRMREASPCSSCGPHQEGEGRHCACSARASRAALLGPVVWLARVVHDFYLRLAGLDYPAPEVGQVWRSAWSGMAIRVKHLSMSDRGVLVVVVQRQDETCRSGWSAGAVYARGLAAWRRALRDEARELVQAAPERVVGRHSFDHLAKQLTASTGTPSVPATAGSGEICRYPDCACPFDAGPEDDWCARNLPKERRP